MILAFFPYLSSPLFLYVATQEERVIGIITDRIMDGYKVDIGSSGLATLSGLAFEGATKKNKPELQPGDLVLARLALANKDMESELSCLTAENRSDGMGPLEDGVCFQVSLSQCRKYV